MTTNKRTKVIQMKLTDSEKDKIVQASEKMNIPTATFSRMVLMKSSNEVLQNE